jgi:tetratricopeptide (TPR) repeat protein
MNPAESQRLQKAFRKFHAGACTEALREVREMAEKLDDRWDQALLCYHETLFLAEMDRAADARKQLTELKPLLGRAYYAPPSSLSTDPSLAWAVMARYAEMKVLIAERNPARTLRAIEDLETRYSKQLCAPVFDEIREEIEIHHGMLLADSDRWAEARPLLEKARPPESWKALLAFYLGQCYYQFRDNKLAKSKLIEALGLGLTDRWRARAHYILGIVQYHLGALASSKNEFELCLQTADAEYLSTTRIWKWLEGTSRALGFDDEAEKYRQRKSGFAVKPPTKPAL